MLCTDEITCPVNDTLNFSVLEKESSGEDSLKKVKKTISGGEK
jgi:hypothetical protein